MRYKDKKIPQDLFSILRDIFCYIAVQIKIYLSVFIHIFVVILIIAASNALYPVLIVQVPDNGFYNTIFELSFGSPS